MAGLIRMSTKLNLADGNDSHACQKVAVLGKNWKIAASKSSPYQHYSLDFQG